MPLQRTSVPAGPAMELDRHFSYDALASFVAINTREHGREMIVDVDRASGPDEPENEAAEHIAARTRLFEFFASRRGAV